MDSPPAPSGVPEQAPAPVTEELTESKVAEMLEVTNGNTQIAADLLEVSKVQLDAFINQSGKLRARWFYDPTPPTETETVSRGPDEPEYTLTDLQLARAADEENKKLKRGLVALGLTEAEQNLAMSLQAFQRDQFKGSMEIIGAGVTRVSIKYQTELDAILYRLNGIRDQLNAIGPERKTGEARRYLVEEEKNLMAAYVMVGDQLRRIFEVSQRGAMTLALIRWRQNGGKPWQKQSRPGFRPKTYDAETGEEQSA